MFFQSLFGFGLLISVFFNGSFSWACSNAVCIGDSVIYSAADKKTQVVATFRSGSFAIKFDNEEIISPVSMNPLAITHGCARGLCIADKVIYSSADKEAQIVGIFQDGTFAVQYASGLIASPVVINHLALVNGGKNFRESCVSADGRVQLITDLGTKPDRTVELIVDWESYGAGILRNEISETVSEFVTTHVELDHDQTLWASTIRNRDGSVTLLDGLNPATGKAMGVQTRLTCTKEQIP